MTQKMPPTTASTNMTTARTTAMIAPVRFEPPNVSDVDGGELDELLAADELELVFDELLVVLEGVGVGNMDVDWL